MASIHNVDVPVGWIRKIGSKYQLRRAVEQRWGVGEVGDPTFDGVMAHDLFEYKVNMNDAMKVMQRCYPQQKLKWVETTQTGMPQTWTAYLVTEDLFAVVH